MGYDLEKPFPLRAARLEQTGGFGGIIAGRNSDFSTTQELLSLQGSIVYPSTAFVASVVSDAAADAAAGTGARTVLVTGLDETWAFQVEEVTLNGLTPVTTTNTFLRTFKVWVRDVGTGGVNAGAITCSLNGNAQICIQAGEGESHCGILSVPAGTRCYISSVSVSGAKDDDVEIDLYTREFGKSWRLRAMDQIREAGKESHFEYYFRVQEKSDIELRCRKITVGTAYATGYFNFIWLPPTHDELTQELL